MRKAGPPAPVRFKAGTNFYRYVENNPARFTDPTGNNPLQHWPLNGNLWPGFKPQDGVYYRTLCQHDE